MFDYFRTVATEGEAGPCSLGAGLVYGINENLSPSRSIKEVFVIVRSKKLKNSSEELRT